MSREVDRQLESVRKSAVRGIEATRVFEAITQPYLRGEITLKEAEKIGDRLMGDLEYPELVYEAIDQLIDRYANSN